MPVAQTISKLPGVSSIKKTLLTDGEGKWLFILDEDYQETTGPKIETLCKLEADSTGVYGSPPMPV